MISVNSVIDRLGDLAGDVGRTARHGFALLRARRPRGLRPVGPRHQSPSFVLAAGLAIAVCVVAMIDPVTLGVLGGAKGTWRHLLKTITWYGEGVEILTISALILLATLAISPDGLSRRTRAALYETGLSAAFAFVSVAGSGLLGSLIKNALGRARPEHTRPDMVFDLHPLAFKARWASFPSGHSITAGATAVVLALLFPRLRRPALILGAVVAVSRILLDAHFPSDVIAGLALGAAVPLALAHALARRGLVFRHAADGRLMPKPTGRSPAWVEALGGVIARLRSAG